MRQALQSSPEDLALLVVLGRILLETGEFNEAITVLSHQKAHSLLGWIEESDVLLDPAKRRVTVANRVGELNHTVFVAGHAGKTIDDHAVAECLCTICDNVGRTEIDATVLGIHQQVPL